MVRTFFRNMFVPDEKEPLSDTTKVDEKSWKKWRKNAMKPGFFKKDLDDLSDQTRIADTTWAKLK